MFRLRLTFCFICRIIWCPLRVVVTTVDSISLRLKAVVFLLFTRVSLRFSVGSSSLLRHFSVFYASFGLDVQILRLQSLVLAHLLIVLLIPLSRSCPLIRSERSFCTSLYHTSFSVFLVIDALIIGLHIRTRP